MTSAEILDDRARLIAERGTILRVQVGSGVHGVTTGDDDLDRLEGAPITVRADPEVERDGLALVQAARLAADVEAQLADYHRGEMTRHEVRRDRFAAIADSAERVVLA